MIALASDCLSFRMESGESIPYSADMISIDFVEGATELVDHEFATHAAHAVFHYFKEELNRQVVTVAEFTEALETVLRGFSHSSKAPMKAVLPLTVESDLLTLAMEMGEACELHFFMRLRSELRLRLRETPVLLRFRGLRACVKKLASARRWSRRCGELEAQILDYLRQCLNAESTAGSLAMVVE